MFDDPKPISNRDRRQISFHIKFHSIAVGHSYSPQLRRSKKLTNTQKNVRPNQGSLINELFLASFASFLHYSLRTSPIVLLFFFLTEDLSHFSVNIFSGAHQFVSAGERSREAEEKMQIKLFSWRIFDFCLLRILLT